MARCEEGYLCEVCGRDVESIAESDLYLRYVIGMIEAEVLHVLPERHIRCHPQLAQFIDHADFPPIRVAGDFNLSNLDPDFVRARKSLVTRGWLRLQEVTQNSVAILEYPLAEFRTPPDESATTRPPPGNAR